MANERTFLAWNRTALALLAGGVALEASGLDLHAGLKFAASLVLMGGGLTIPVLAWIEWARTERALRFNSALPASRTALMLVGTILVVGILVTLGIIF
ncbi:MAG: DUF202 domain-containing protein [Devosia sp.]|nr:DUF202 domain-containing protein [Devosia sp.]